MFSLSIIWVFPSWVSGTNIVSFRDILDGPLGMLFVPTISTTSNLWFSRCLEGVLNFGNLLLLFLLWLASLGVGHSCLSWSIAIIACLFGLFSFFCLLLFLLVLLLLLCTLAASMFCFLFFCFSLFLLLRPLSLGCTFYLLFFTTCSLNSVVALLSI